MEYSTYDIKTGETVQVYDLEKCLKAIRMRNQVNEEEIERLKKENKKLRDENFKDEEIQKMQSKLDEMQKDYYRGFPISKKEEKAIEKWKKKHKCKGTNMEGCCGGRYSYCFVPTSIGVSGVIKCSCGAEFEFQEIG